MGSKYGLTCPTVFSLTPIIIVNRGRTRADDLATLKVEDDCVRAFGTASKAIAHRAAKIEIYQKKLYWIEIDHSKPRAYTCSR